MPRGAGTWSREEDEAIVSDYFLMLAKELRASHLISLNTTDDFKSFSRVAARDLLNSSTPISAPF
jgi:hypothetical protein